MFTGLVQALGRVCGVLDDGDDRTLVVDIAELETGTVRIGDSVALNGVCLTVTRREGPRAWFDVSAETLSCTLLGEARVGDRINLEPALRADSRLGGHFVTGHVDAVGTLLEKTDDARSVRMRFAAPAVLSRYIAEKGSVTIDGVSLTVNRVHDSGQRVEFEINIVAHTQTATTFGTMQSGDGVHVEVDLLARYLERLQRDPDNSARIQRS